MPFADPVKEMSSRASVPQDLMVMGVHVMVRLVLMKYISIISAILFDVFFMHYIYTK